MAADAVGDSFLNVVAAGESLTIAAGDVAEIVRMPVATRVPNGPACLLGLINLRGTVLPVVSLARLVGGDPGAPGASARVVVIDRRGSKLGLLVDAVSALARTGDGRRLALDTLLAQGFARPARTVAAHRDLVAAARAPEAAVADDRLAMIAIDLAGQDYGLPLDQVSEVVRLPDAATDVPRSDATADRALAGVMALRGRLLPLVSLRALLGLPDARIDRNRARVVVTRLGVAPFGLVVDGVRDIVRVGPDAIDPVPAVLTRGTGEARIEGICRLDGGRRLLCILSPTRLFDDATAARIRAQEEDRMSATPAGSDAAAQFVIFQLGDEQYGLPIAAVDEVVRRPASLTRVPLAPGFVAGVMNLRGRAVPVINQRDRFAVAGAGGGGRVIVVTVDGLQAGFVVDAVSEVLRVTQDSLLPVPDLTDDGAKLFDRIVAHDGRMILLVDPKALLDKAERDLLAAMVAAAPAVAS